jgi:hypothetical protein
MIYDINTTNRSFLKVAYDLKTKNVKNNKFMLALYDESLVGVNPFDPDLKNEQKIAIYRECSINQWYYFREVVRVPAEGRIDGVPYKLNLGNLSLSYLKLKNKNQIVILPRQFGKTLGEIIYDSWIMLFAATNTNIIYSNKEFKDSKKNLKIFKDLRDRLPRYLVEFIQNSKGDKDNEEYKLVFNRNNTLRAMAAANSEDSADKLGRGMTSSNLYFDEFAFLARNETIFLAAAPAWSTASMNAKKAGVPYGITITTTPNNVDTKQGAYAKKIIEKAAVWRLECFDMTDEELNLFVENNSSNGFIFVQFTYKELGRDETWLKEQLRTFQGDLAKIKREFLLEWPRSTDFSIFNEDQLDKIVLYVKKPTNTITVNGYFIDFYESPDINTNYIISCDVAGGLSQDNSVITIIAPDDFRVVGDFRNNKIDTENFKKLVEELMKNWFRNAILIIERNSYGLNLNQYFMKDREVEPRMLREEKEQIGEKTQKDGFTVKRTTKNIIYGVDTNSKTRKLMFELLPEIVENEYDKIISPKLYEDIAGLERKKTGKVEHSDTSHDDSLMSYLIFRYALHYGKCLKDRFKINAIPNKGNIKTISSADNIQRIERVIQAANVADNMGANGLNSDMFNYLVEKNRRMGNESETSSALQRILDLNK